MFSMERSMKTVIMAGGKGTRITSIASDIPKPMIKINNKPILEHEIECLRTQGFTDLIITVSHMSSVIMDYFGDGRKFGVGGYCLLFVWFLCGSGKR